MFVYKKYSIIYGERERERREVFVTNKGKDDRRAALPCAANDEMTSGLLLSLFLLMTGLSSVLL